MLLPPTHLITTHSPLIMWSNRRWEEGFYFSTQTCQVLNECFCNLTIFKDPVNSACDFWVLICGWCPISISANNADWLGEFGLILKCEKIYKAKNNCLDINGVCSVFQLCHKQIHESTTDYRCNVIIYAQMQLNPKHSLPSSPSMQLEYCIHQDCIFIKQQCGHFSTHRMNKSNRSFKAVLVSISNCAVWPRKTVYCSTPL